MSARHVMAVGLCAALLAGIVSGESAPRAKRKTDGWKRQVQAGVNVTEGNKDATQTRVQIGAKGGGANWTSEFQLSGEIGETAGERTRERVAAEAEVRQELSARSYSAYRMEFLYDGIADLDYRIVVSPSFGYHILRDKIQHLRAEAGPAGVLEKKGDEQEAYPALRLAEYYECRITAVSRLLQGIEYLPELRAGSGSYLVKAYLELKADLDVQLGLHVRLESEYDSEPADGKEKQDTTFSASISYSF